MQDLNQSFAENDIKPGKRPESDAPLAGGFASFRTEDAARTSQGAEAVKQDPVYQVLHEHQSSL